MESSPRPFFSSGSPYLSHPLLTAERTAREVDEIERLIGRSAARVLDIGCGFGRHAIEFASRGAQVMGVDPSPTMIESARRHAIEANAAIDLRCATMSEVEFDAEYDLVVCLFTSLGQQHGPQRDDAPHHALLSCAAKALQPGGVAVVELPDRDRAVSALVESETLGPTQVTRSFDSVASTITERFDMQSGDTFELHYRVYDRAELSDLIADAGLAVEQVRDRGLAEPPGTMTTVLARRPATAMR